jgi:NADPH2:quinone reductase
MRILGTEIAGIVEKVGRDVTRFHRGDQVFGFTGFSLGANAEYAVMPENGSLALKPPNISFEEAAAVVDGATTALYFLRDRAKVRPGQRVLVNGASGSIGTYAVQLAKHLGAQVTGVCGPGNIDLVTSLGADRVIDYTEHDFTKDGEKYDVIFDTVGRSSFRRCKAALTSTGCYVPTTGLPNTGLMLWTALTRGPRVVTGMSVKKNDALTFISKLIDSDELTIVIDRTYPLEHIADAHRFVETGHKRGSVVVLVSPQISNEF